MKQNFHIAKNIENFKCGETVTNSAIQINTDGHLKCPFDVKRGF